jgi:hypothetical protein
MRKIREVLRLRLEAELSIRQISASTKTSVGAIQKVLARADALEIVCPLPEDLDDGRLAAMFYPGSDPTTLSHHQVSDWTTIYQELKRKNVTKLLLWEEYTTRYPDRCYSYSQYCDRYWHWHWHWHWHSHSHWLKQQNAPCARLTRPVRNASWITVAPPYPLFSHTRAESVRLRCLS